MEPYLCTMCSAYFSGTFLSDVLVNVSCTFQFCSNVFFPLVEFVSVKAVFHFLFVFIKQNLCFIQKKPA